ncbi:MAG TPA: MBL fold metallo-hydrolase [Flavobacteriales bacterium]|nr:MBL fold metallo-hydrolase [Flavobacteriales bacterium]
MLRIAKFTFNPFQENTYVLHDGKQAIVIDPGCWNGQEERELETYLTDNALTPVRLVLTHGHIDHILGCAWMHKKYGLLPQIHLKDLPTLKSGERAANMYGIPYNVSPDPEVYLTEGGTVQLGDHRLEILWVPGHAPGHIALHCAAQHFVISGDVLFLNSIGRTDLPGGDTDTLLRSIRDQLFPLGDDVTVYSGHGPETTIGREKRNNPFLRTRT